jgi:predicted MFS family arabinose efflux permease
MTLLTSEATATRESSATAERTTSSTTSPNRTGRVFPWLVFSLTFALLLSDYMSRQVLSAVFPFLKQDWGLSDTKLGSLTSVVALTVGLLAVPLSLIGDRWGRTRAIVAMGAIWSLATLGSALAANYEQLLLARVLIGVGEAAYGSVGLAVVLAVFPRHKRASLTGAFMAGGSFGAVLGVLVGGNIAARLGWRASFAIMAIFGLVMVALYRLVVSDSKLARYRHPDNRDTTAATSVALRTRLGSLFSTPSVICAYIGSGLQLCVVGALMSWLPSYLNRTYGLSTAKSASYAAVFILIIGLGMIYCGSFTDRLARRTPIRKWTSAIVYATVSLVFLGTGFAAHTGWVQVVLLGIGSFFAAGTAGPAGAMVSNLTAEPIRATALGTLTLANSVLGLAAGPFVVGVLADHFGLVTAMKVIPFVSIPVIVALFIGRQTYTSSLRKVNPEALEVRADEDSSTRPRGWAGLLATGAVLQVVAVLLAFVMTPQATRLPDKADVTAHLAGTVTMLNKQAIKDHDLAHVFVRNAPLTVDRRLHVTSTANHGNTAIVAVDQTLHVGQAAMPSTHVYAVDRTSREAVPAPAGKTVEPATGLTIGYPFAPKAASVYSYYDPTTQLAGPVSYTGKATVGGRSVNVYRTNIAGPVKDPGMLATLPAALPKPVLAALASRLPAPVRAKLAPALKILPAVIPLHYVSTSATTAYVDRVTGSAVDQAVQQQIVATISVGGRQVNLVPVLALDARVTPSSVHTLATRVAKAEHLLKLLGTQIPLILVILGLGFEAAALLRRRKNRKLAVVDAASIYEFSASGIR